MGRRVRRPAGSLVFRALCSLLPVLALLVAGVSATSASASADPVQVVTSDRSGLELTVSGLETTWREVTLRDGQVVLHEPQVAGFTTSGTPGTPRLPRTGGWLVVPPGTRPVLDIVSESWAGSGARPLNIQTVPVVIPGEEPGLGSTAEMLVLPGESLPVDVHVPDEIRADFLSPDKSRNPSGLALGETGWWRGRRIVAWTLVPVRHDPSGVATGVLQAGSWRIRFVPDSDKSAIPPGHRAKTATRGDNRFGSLFLNGELLDTLPTEAAYRGEIPSRSLDEDKRGAAKAPGQLEAKLAVLQTHLYRVPFSRLTANGYLPPGPVREDQIRLYQRRYLSRLDGTDAAPWVDIEVPIHMVGDGGNFEGDEFFLFYGLRLRDDTEYTADVGQGPETIPGAGDPREMNNEVNYYWLAAVDPPAGQAWARMETVSLPSATLPVRTGYRRTNHYEEQLAFRENVPSVYSDRVYFNQYDDDLVSVGLNPLYSPDASGGTVDLKVGISGYNDLDWDLKFELVTDNTLTTHLEDWTISDIGDTVRSYSLPASAIDGREAKVVMSINDFPPRTKINAFVNWVEISYDALYQAVGDELTFHGDDVAGPQPMEVGGFSSSDIGLVEITDPRNPVFVTTGGGNVRQEGDDWVLSIQPTQGAERRTFYAVEGVSTTGVVEFTYFKSELADNQINPWTLSGPAPDLVVITHSAFIEGLAPWLEHRRERAGGDLAIHVVDVQDLFDWFSGGLRDAWAIKRFSDQLAARWGTWAVTFVGDANENARELGVLNAGKAWSRDWVPTHYHVQKAQQYAPELLASDKWFATLQSGQTYPVEDFPDSAYLPYEFYLGRLPCNNLTELNTMVGKIQTVETVEAGQDWRRRAILFADDAWSNGYGIDALSYFEYKPWEEDFAESERDSLAAMWRGATPVTLDADTLFLDNFLHPQWVLEGRPVQRNASEYKDHAEDYATQPLLRALNRGGLLCHYQGHGNIYVLSSEYWFEDRMALGYRKDVASLVNANSPWVFFGMGCHIGDWAQSPYYNSIYPREQSLCEKFLVRQGGGASAAYGSSGYEYIDSNVVFGEYIFRRWLRKPPTRLLGTAPGTDHPSRWMLGELMWASEADVLAVLGGSTSYRRMVSQYELLGDPLMVLDGGEPEISATLTGTGGGEISGTVEVVALDATSRRLINMSARDEAGISRIVVQDSLGTDLTDEVVSETVHGAAGQQWVDYTLDMPVRPFDHYVTVDVWDTGADLASDRHYTLKLVMSQAAAFTAGGDPVDPEDFIFPQDVPVDFTGQVSLSAWVEPGAEMSLTSDDLELDNIVLTVGKARDLSLSFTGLVTDGQNRGRSVVLTIDGFASTYELQAGSAERPPTSISEVYNFPNPMQDNTRFLFRTGAPGGQGRVRVFSVTGRSVAQVPFNFLGGSDGGGVVDWSGRDDDGDALANGTYLYRIELETGQGLITSEMQRLVVMR